MTATSSPPRLAELVVTAQMLEELGVTREVYAASHNVTLPYCQYVGNAEIPGDFTLLLFLHGAGSRGTENYLQARIPAPALVRFCQQRQKKAVLLFPQCPPACQWVEVPWGASEHSMPTEPSHSMAIVQKLLADKAQEFQVPAAKMALAGISMGGYGLWDLAMRQPDQFKTLLAICGGADNSQAQLLQKTRILLLHGSEDQIVPVQRSRSLLLALQAAGNTSVQYRELTGVGHNAWDYAFADDILEWLFSV